MLYALCGHRVFKLNSIYDKLDKLRDKRPKDYALGIKFIEGISYSEGLFKEAIQKIKEDIQYSHISPLDQKELIEKINKRVGERLR
jgi:hypothetical protein